LSCCFDDFLIQPHGVVWGSGVVLWGSVVFGWRARCEAKRSGTLVQATKDSLGSVDSITAQTQVVIFIVPAGSMAGEVPSPAL
jgi:hypothetical protein